MKKIIAKILLSAMLITSLVGCGSTDSAGESSTNGKIGLAVSTLNNPFFVSLVDGAKAEALALGYELIVVDASDDSAKQVSDIEDLLSKKIDVLIVNPVDSSAAAFAVQDAIDAGVKVIAVDRAVEGVEVNVSIASDNVMGAELATAYLVELIGEGADVLELKGVEGSSAAIDRGEGFHNIADTKLNVVGSQTANFNRAEGLSVTENLLQANSGVTGIFAHNDEMALGALEAAGGKDIAIIGFDATDDAVAAVEAGTLKATIAQNPSLMGKTAVEAADKLVKGEAVDAVIGVEVELIK